MHKHLYSQTPIQKHFLCSVDKTCFKCNEVEPNDKLKCLAFVYSNKCAQGTVR